MDEFQPLTSLFPACLFIPLMCPHLLFIKMEHFIKSALQRSASPGRCSHLLITHPVLSFPAHRGCSWINTQHLFLGPGSRSLHLHCCGKEISLVQCISLLQTGFGASTSALKGGKGLTSCLNCEVQRSARGFVQLQPHSDLQTMAQMWLQHKQEPGSVSQKGLKTLMVRNTPDTI